MKHLYCIINGHQLKTTKQVTFHIKEYKCKRCKAIFTTSQNGTITPLTDKRAEINLVLERIHSKKTRKLKLDFSNSNNS